MSLVKILALTIRPEIKSFAIPSATHVRKSGLYYGNNVDFSETFKIKYYRPHDYGTNNYFLWFNSRSM